MKSQKIALWAKRLILASVIAAGTGTAVASGDQIWLKGSLEAQPFQSEESAAYLKPLRLKFEQEFKYDDSRLIDEESLLLVGYKFSPLLTVWAGDRFVRERKGGKGELIDENRPTLDLCLALPEFATLKLDLRSRFEYRQKSGSDDYMRYRERARLQTSWSATSLRISPFLSEELFYSDKKGKHGSDTFDRLRSQLGFSFQPLPSNKALRGSLYYMVQHDIKHHPENWNPTSVFGFELSYKF